MITCPPGGCAAPPGSHLVNKDNETEANSIGRYKGEFRAYFLSEFAGVKDEAARARQVRAHILRDYRSGTGPLR